MDTTITIALVLGLTQIFKQFGYSSRWTPIFAIVMGIGISFISMAGSVGEQALGGVIVGLIACGLWSGSKAIITGK